MSDKRNKKHCKGCPFHWAKGLNKSDCFFFGKPTADVYKHCINTKMPIVRQGGAE